MYWKICKLRKGVEKYEKKFFYGSCSGVSITANTGKCNAGGWKIRTCKYEPIVEYAWSLDYPQQATYDNILEKTESGAAQAVNMLPSAALGYQIKDYDGDDQMELLVVRSDTTQESNQSQLIFQIYEASEGNIVLASEITADMPSFVTGVGKIRVYSRNMGDKIVIGCDQYEEGFLWDGLTLKTSYYDYNGSVLNYNSGTNVMGSIIESDYICSRMV